MYTVNLPRTYQLGESPQKNHSSSTEHGCPDFFILSLSCINKYLIFLKKAVIRPILFQDPPLRRPDTQSSTDVLSIKNHKVINVRVWELKQLKVEFLPCILGNQAFVYNHQGMSNNRYSRIDCLRVCLGLPRQLRIPCLRVLPDMNQRKQQ